MLNKVNRWKHVSKRKTWAYRVLFVYLALVAAFATACKGNARFDAYSHEPQF